MGSEVHKLQVLFFPLMVHGHMIPMMDIARHFSILTTPPNASNISPKIACYQNLGPDINIATIPFPTEEAGLPKGCENVDSITAQDMFKFFHIALPMLQPQLKQVLQQLHPDCIVSDMFLTWTTDVAREHGIPRLVFHGTNFFTFCVSDSLKRYSPRESNSETFVVPGLPDEITMKKSQMPDRPGSDDSFEKMMDRVKETEVTSFGVLVNSFYALEPAYAAHYRKVLGRRAWHIGPVSLTNSDTIDKAERGKKAGIDEHYCLNWLNSKDHNSVIYISFGSMAHIGSVQLMEIAEGLEASGVTFIWVVKRARKEEEDKSFLEGFKERMGDKRLSSPSVNSRSPGNWRICCGWNSIQEGVSAGLPMLTWPLFAELFQNEVLLTQVLKIGIKASVDKWQGPADLERVLVEKEKVEEVVCRLMKSEEGEEMRKKARELKEMAKRAVEEGGSSYSDFSYLIEELHQSALIKQNNV